MPDQVYNLDINVAGDGGASLGFNLDSTEAALGLTVEAGGDVYAARAEIWATGEYGGQPVSSSDPAYHNNAKYYAESIQDAYSVATGECFCLETGVISAFPLTITDARIDESCIVIDEPADDDVRVDIGWVTEEGRIILYGTLPTGQTLASRKLKIRRCHGLTSEDTEVNLRLLQVTSENGNYLVAETRNLIPGIQYSWRLFSVSGGAETYVYGIGTTPHWPSYNMYFQEVQRGLVDGTVYRIKVHPTTDSSNPAVSNDVTFVGGSGVQQGGE